ncbi:hypothetical protein LU276_03845 [Moraxella haemolytica]|uniref:BRO-N domain-containing protein n=1 Tax=Moraxella haemolytica TaxID=2904119 RepID=UPI002543B06C|nr:BRO family protein [Moraxella sp. ZY171148]WII95956.1 hypothetical protein LU276_03845 [Moraxella sp. ZY171148]
MNNQIINFTFEAQTVRTATNPQGEIYFCLPDVANVLEIQNSRDIVAKQLDKAGVEKIYISYESGKKQVTFINEPNLYRVIFRSNKAEAVKFQNWVFDEVLPSIRKTGSYQTPTPTQRTATPAELQAIKTRVHFISGNFHFKEGASAEIYNRLRVEFNLANIADIQPHQLDKAHQILDEIDRHAKAYAQFRYELDKQAQGYIIRQGRPYTPHIKAKLTKLGATIGHAPDWQALQAQLA